MLQLTDMAPRRVQLRVGPSRSGAGWAFWPLPSISEKMGLCYWPLSLFTCFHSFVLFWVCCIFFLCLPLIRSLYIYSQKTREKKKWPRSIWPLTIWDPESLALADEVSGLESPSCIPPKWGVHGWLLGGRVDQVDSRVAEVKLVSLFSGDVASGLLSCESASWPGSSCWPRLLMVVVGEELGPLWDGESGPGSLHATSFSPTLVTRPCFWMMAYPHSSPCLYPPPNFCTYMYMYTYSGDNTQPPRVSTILSFCSYMDGPRGYSA